MAGPAASSPRPTMRDIGKAMGLSHVTVSLALRDSRRLSDETREAVQAMARKMGYQPDPMLSSLMVYRRAKSSAAVPIQACIAWLNQWERPEELRSYKEFDLYWQGASEMAGHLGYRLEEFRWPLHKSGGRLQQIWQTRCVRGVLVPPHRRDVDLPEVNWDLFSIVKFGASVNSLPAHSVSSDQGHCARVAYENALKLGYRRIGYVSSAAFESRTQGHFLEGYLLAQASVAASRSRPTPLIVEGDAPCDQEKVRRWLARDKPDGILTSLTSLRSALKGLGLRVPEDIGLAATSVLDGDLSAGADQNSLEIGRVAMSTLAGLILENQRGLPEYQRRVLVQGRWIGGASMPSRSPDRGKKTSGASRAQSRIPGRAAPPAPGLT